MRVVARWTRPLARTRIPMAIEAQREALEGQPDQPTGPKQDAAERFDWLPCRVTLEVPISECTLGSLLRLGKDAVLATGLRSTADVPLLVNNRLVAWIQFEMIADKLAARITELA